MHGVAVRVSRGKHQPERQGMVDQSRGTGFHAAKKKPPHRGLVWGAIEHRPEL